MSYIWLETASNSQFVLYNSSALSIADRGLTYGDGLFETVRILNSTPVFLNRHLARLMAGLTTISLSTPWDAAALTDRCHQVIARNQLTEGVLRITITRGSGPRGFAPPPETSPTLIIQTFASPLLVRPPSGLTGIIAPWRIDPNNPLCQLKHLAALDKVLAKDLARKQGADEAIFLNTNHHLAETTSWSLFVVDDGQILTPALHCGVLPGITRQVLLELAPAIGYRIIEAELRLDRLTSATEAFLTNAVSGIRPLIQVDGRPIGTGEAGPVTNNISNAYQDYLAGASSGRDASSPKYGSSA